jgi:hypothetical protein
MALYSLANKRSKTMEIMAKVREWAQGLADVGISIAALLIVVEVLGLGNIPFFPETSIIANVSAMLGSLGAEGLMGLLAIWVLYQIWDRR